jgi:transcriptional regulator with XRE-family HTH domain
LAKLNLQNALQTKLQESKMTPTELENKAGLARSTVFRILEGRATNPTIETLYAIAQVLGCSVDELIDGQRVRQKTSSLDLLKAIEDRVWNSNLFLTITNATCDYLKKIDKNLTFKPMLESILEIYNYCIIKKDAEFDNNFHEWYMQKMLEKYNV